MDENLNLYKRTSNSRPPLPTADYYNQFNGRIMSHNASEYGEHSRHFEPENEVYYAHPQHRTTSIHRNASLRQDFELRRTPQNAENRRAWVRSAGDTIGRTPLEEHANRIVDHMERDEALMEDSPMSEQLRRETLRDMPQCLTIKRHIKSKLLKSVSEKSKHRPVGYFKRLKYRWSISMSKFQTQLKNLAYTFELWYSTLKVIEGHFGSSVATYFKFLRRLFILDFFVMVFVLFLVVIPNLLYVFLVNKSSDEIYHITDFHVDNIFTGGGYFTNSSLFYGYYTNSSFSLVGNVFYNMPHAYFFTMLCLIITCFVILSVSMARSYRRNFIETEGGLTNIYAQKIFCGWDYGIATREAAELKSSSIYFELKELLSEMDTYSLKRSCANMWFTRATQITANILIIIFLGGVGYIMWLLLEAHRSNLSTTDESTATVSVLTAVFINIIMFILPMCFSYVVKYEDYKNPKITLNVTLLRTFLLEMIVVGVLMGFWLTHSESESCWESSLGQEIYRLILFDFMFSVVLAAVVEIGWYCIYKITPKYHTPEFNIATHTLNIIYNQTLFWIGLFYAPLLSLMIVIKLWLTWYVRKYSLLYLHKPSAKSWRSAQMQTWFLIMTFLSLLMVIGVYGFIMIAIESSNCGPFKDYQYIYSMVIESALQLSEANFFWQILIYFTRAGVIALILIGMGLRVYYLRAKAVAQRGMVKILQEMLVWEAKDKEFLLAHISKITKGQWQYNLQESRAGVMDPVITAPKVASIQERICREDEGDRAEEFSYFRYRPSDAGSSLSASTDDVPRYKKYH